MWSRRCILISLSLLITMTNGGVVDDERQNESFHNKIVGNLPKKSDFEYYLTALEKIVNFCKKHKIYVDVNMYFGLFLMDVNLKALYKEKRMIFTKGIRFRLDSLFGKFNELTDYLHDMIKKHKSVNSKDPDMMFAQLFHNRTTWPRNSDAFSIELLIQTKFHTLEQLQNMYGKWDRYYEYVIDLKKCRPSPKESDECIAQLMATRGPKSQSTCQFSDNCKQLVYKGSEYGYGLTHRILFMVIARFSRECVVFSEKADKIMTDRFCMMAFNEAEYIASNNFELSDLMFEQIGVCGLFGHAQFIRNSWLKSILLYQTPQGCFSEKIADGRFEESLMKEKRTDRWKLHHTHNIMNGQCNVHLTAGAAAALSTALRYIMESYY